jgi:hypothetical protein
MRYLITTQFSGYSRGNATFTVDADSEEEARELWFEGVQETFDVIRDDREYEILAVERAPE